MGWCWSLGPLPGDLLTEDGREVTGVIRKLGYIPHNFLGLLPVTMNPLNRVVIPLHICPTFG